MAESNEVEVSEADVRRYAEAACRKPTTATCRCRRITGWSVRSWPRRSRTGGYLRPVGVAEVISYELGIQEGCAVAAATIRAADTSGWQGYSADANDCRDRAAEIAETAWEPAGCPPARRSLLSRCDSQQVDRVGSVNGRPHRVVGAAKKLTTPGRIRVRHRYWPVPNPSAGSRDAGDHRPAALRAVHRVRAEDRREPATVNELPG